MRRLENILVLAAALMGGLLFALSGIGVRLDGALFDALAPRLGQPQPAPQVVVVHIKQAEYAQAHTPLSLWGLHLAPLITRLASSGTKAIGLDMVLPQFSLQHVSRDHDRLLLGALKQAARTTRLVSGYVIMASGRVQLPHAAYQGILGQEGLGFLNLTADRDGVLRSQTVATATNGGRALYCFAAQAAGVRPPGNTCLTPDWRNPVELTTYSYRQAMQAPVEAFKDKVVLVGLDLPSQDRHRTPAAPQGEAGVNFHARVAQALLSGQALRDPGRVLSGLAPALVLGLLLMLISQQAPARRMVWLGLGGLVVLGLMLWLGLMAGIVLRVSWGLITLALLVLSRVSQGYLLARMRLHSSRGLLGGYLGPGVQGRLEAGERLELSGQQMPVAVLYCRLKGLAFLPQNQEAQAAVDFLNQFFAAMSQEVLAHGGGVDTCQGQGMLCVFGAPFALGNAAQAALQAALAMARRLEELQPMARRLMGVTVGLGIAVHHGLVLAGSLGPDQRRQYHVSGEVVDIACFLEGLNQEFGSMILASREAIEQAGRLEEGLSLGQVPIRGNAPMEIFRLL